MRGERGGRDDGLGAPVRRTLRAIVAALWNSHCGRHRELSQTVTGADFVTGVTWSGDVAVPSIRRRTHVARTSICALPLLLIPPARLLLRQATTTMTASRSPRASPARWSRPAASLADAHVRLDVRPSTNFGTATTLLVDGNDGGAVMHTYLKFSIGNVGTITSAKLRLYVSDASAGPIRGPAGLLEQPGRETGHHLEQQAGDRRAGGDHRHRHRRDLAGDRHHQRRAAEQHHLARDPPGHERRPRPLVAQRDQQPAADRDRRGRRRPAARRARPAARAPPAARARTGSAGTTGSGGARPSTDPNLKIAFVGDTADGTNWRNVLKLALAEGAPAVVTAGDMTYDSDPAGWWSATESGRRPELSRSSWRAATTTTRPGRASSAEAANHLGVANRIAGPHNAAYKTIFRGLDIVTIQKGDTGTTITNLFGTDNHIWKVCNWHQNQNKMQVGGKGDEMGWAVYEACRQKGAIIITGHEHTYHRTKTMTNTPDPDHRPDLLQRQQPLRRARAGPSSPSSAPAAPACARRCAARRPRRRAPLPVAEHQRPQLPDLGVDLHHQPGRELRRQFITFNVDGNPKKAHGLLQDHLGHDHRHLHDLRRLKSGGSASARSQSTSRR